MPSPRRSVRHPKRRSVRRSARRTKRFAKRSPRSQRSPRSNPRSYRFSLSTVNASMVPSLPSSSMSSPVPSTPGVSFPSTSAYPKRWNVPEIKLPVGTKDDANRYWTLESDELVTHEMPTDRMTERELILEYDTLSRDLVEWKRLSETSPTDRTRRFKEAYGSPEKAIERALKIMTELEYRWDYVAPNAKEILYLCLEMILTLAMHSAVIAGLYVLLKWATKLIIHLTTDTIENVTRYLQEWKRRHPNADQIIQLLAAL